MLGLLLCQAECDRIARVSGIINASILQYHIGPSPSTGNIVLLTFGARDWPAKMFAFCLANSHCFRCANKIAMLAAANPAYT